MRRSAEAGSLAGPRYTPGTSRVRRRAETSARVRKLKPGDQPPAAPSRTPPRREARDELKPTAAFRVMPGGTHPGRSWPGSVDDLDPDHAVPGPDRDRDRLPSSTRAGVPDTVTEDLAHQQDRIILARVPGPEHLADERAGGTRPLHRPASVTLSRTATLAISAPAFPAALVPGIARAAGRTHRDGRPTRRHASSQPAPGAARPCGPWKAQRLHRPCRRPETGPLCVRGHRNLTVHSATR
jgi:hypothetical protein